MEAYKVGNGLCPSSIELCKSRNASSILPTFVNFSAFDGINRMFTVPLICQLNVDKEWCRILPSELWAIKTEVEGWNEFPCMCSYCVLGAILGLGVVRECDLAIWVSANSPQCGVVIDVAMRDHKEIQRENFECPTLVQALTWLASQLSILYGAQNGKVFAISVLKKCISDAVMASLIFPLEQQVTRSPALEEASSNLDANGNGVRNTEALKPLSTDGEGDSMMKENIISRVVFVSQVAAAVAALHEGSLLEEKLTAQWVSKTLARYQQVVDHDYLSQRAHEERKNRNQYKPIIDHDDWEKSRNQVPDRHTRNRRERDDLEVTKTKHHETKMSSSSISKYKDNRSSSRSNSHQKSKVRRDRYTYENHSSNSMEQNTFDDRYDPLEPRDVYEDNLSTNRKYARASRHSEKEKIPNDR